MTDELKYSNVKEDEEKPAYLITVKIVGASPEAALKLAKPENIVHVDMEEKDNSGRITQVFGRR